MKLALEKFNKDEVLGVFCDTQYEHPYTYEHVEKLESLEFDYHTMCTISDYTIIQDQKELVEFLTGKLKNTISLLGD